MMSNSMNLINDLEVVIRALSPEINTVQLKIRVEEILNGYNVTVKTTDQLQMDLLDNIRLYISSKRLEGLSELTLDDYYRELVSFEYFVNKPTVKIETSDIRSYLSKNTHVMVSTNAKKLSVIKSFFTWLVDEEIILRNPSSRIKQLKQPKRLPKALTAIELEQLREACITLRERAMVEVMFSTGCRLSEVSNMTRKGIDWTTGSMSVIGKGDKERIVYLNPKSVYHIKQYLEGCVYSKNDCGYLFSTERRPYRQLQNKSIQDIIQKVSKRTSINKNITPHTFRHTMATQAMENGIELGDLQQLLGHESANTTLRYAQVSEERKHHAHKRFVK